MRYNPPKFNGKMSTNEGQKLEYATFLSIGETEYWWGGMQQMMEARDKAINWANFRTRFMG